MEKSADHQLADDFLRLVRTVGELRSRCPWDREQKLSDLPRHILEECYEAADAIERGDSPETADELGDLMIQVLFACVIAAEDSSFDLDLVLHRAITKLIRRHPHIYGTATAETVDQVLQNWERIKQEERPTKKEDSLLSRVGRGLPSLIRAEKLGIRARLAGMDWADVGDVLAKVGEELSEAQTALAAGDTEAAIEEIGDMMLALANVPRFVGRSAEQTLARACEKFVVRFGRLEKLAAGSGIDLSQLEPSEVEALWQRAKRPPEEPR